MPTIQQKQVFERPTKGIRKIILATNIAETSTQLLNIIYYLTGITIDDVVYVVDGGIMKEKGYDAQNKISTFFPVWISKANSKQRRGRAGRVQPGKMCKI